MKIDRLAKSVPESLLAFSAASLCLTVAALDVDARGSEFRDVGAASAVGGVGASRARPSVRVATPGHRDPLLRNGWYVHHDSIIWGWIQHNGWWRAGQRPNLTRRSVGDPLGDVRPNRTEDLEKLTDSMLRFGYPGFEHNYGLWFDRRRDAHDTVRRTDPHAQPPFLEQPWARSGTGTAWDGLSRYDLAKFNPWYFERLKAFANLCDEKGTVLFHKYYLQHALLESPTHYVDFPWRPANCIQETGMPDSIPAANVFYDVSHPGRRALHRAYIRECLDTLGDNTHVVHLIGQEYTGPLSFVQFWMDTILEWEQETGKNIHLGLGAPSDVQDAVLSDPLRRGSVDTIDLRYGWTRDDGRLFAPRGGEQVAGRGLERGSQQAQECAPRVIYRKIRKYRDRYPKKGIIDAIEASRQQHWAFFMAGGSLLVGGTIEYPGARDPQDYIQPARVDVILPSYTFVRDRLATRLPGMRPAEIVRADAEPIWCLADAGRSYLVYALSGGEVPLDLSDANGRFEVHWFDPRTGEIHGAPAVIGGGPLALRAPTRHDWAVWLDKAGDERE